MDKYERVRIMPQFFLNKRLIILLVSIIFLVALIGFSLKDRRSLTWPEQFVKDSAGLVQTALHQPAQLVAGFFENVGDIRNTYKENKLLKARLNEFATLETQVQELKQDNEKLNEILDKKERLGDYTVIQGTVIARNPDRWHEQIIVNKGQQDGVEEDMAVITATGLIGKIKSASQFTSTVQLLSAPDRKNRISAVIQGDKKIFGLIEGYDEKKEALLLRKIQSTDVKIEKDQNVITSGLGGKFPSGLSIGKIMEVVPDEYGLTKMAYIKPSADFYDIDHVMIVKRSMITADDELENGDKEEEK